MRGVAGRGGTQAHSRQRSCRSGSLCRAAGHEPAPVAACQQSNGPYTGSTSTDMNRRALVLSALTLPPALLCPPPSSALKAVTLRDGTKVDVFEHGMSLNIVALRGSVPSEWILDFKQTLGKYAGFALGQRGQIEEIYKELSDPPDTKNSAAGADVVTLGDAWLGPAIRQGLVQPLPYAEGQRWWRALPPHWQALVRRNAQGQQDPRGQVYGAPYRWGATLIAYRRDRLLMEGGHLIQDWHDLLQPALCGRIAMTDSSREFMGVALKTLVCAHHAPHAAHARGKPAGSQTCVSPLSPALGFNATAAGLAAKGLGEKEVTEAARALQKQVKLFSSRDHIRAFAAGDVWAMVGWSQDLISVAERSNNVGVLIPSSGTALFADVWTVPSGAQGGHMQSGPSPLLTSWLEFSNMPARVGAHSSLKSGASTLLLPGGPLSAGASSPLQQQGGNLLAHDSGYLPKDPSCLRRSEFLLPLDAETLALYGKVLTALQKGPQS